MNLSIMCQTQSFKDVIKPSRGKGKQSFYDMKDYIKVLYIQSKTFDWRDQKRFLHIRNIQQD